MTENRHSFGLSLFARVFLPGLVAVLGVAAGACSGTAAPRSGAATGTSQENVEPWPGQNSVMTGDARGQFGKNLSGLFYEPAQGGAPAVLWGVLNSPGTVYRLVFDGDTWTFDTAGGWGAGKTLRYPDGTGDPDAEGVTRAELTTPFFYTATERDNAAGVSRLSVLRFDSSAAGAELTAVQEWNLTADLPVVDDNQGLEGITWIPDSYLVAQGFLDESRGGAYDPAQYPDHGTGLFVVGLEATGTLYAYALDHAAGTFQKIATIPSGQPQVMGLEFDRDTGALWAACDDHCDGRQSVLGIEGGKLVVQHLFARPRMPNLNDEGIAIAPASECSGGFKKFFWSDDGNTGGHSLRIDSIPCGPLF